MISSTDNLVQDNDKSLKNEHKQAPLHVFFLDSSKEFGSAQSELLATALHLQNQGFVPHICCPESSTLMQKASEHALLTLCIASASAKKPSLMALMHLFWRQKRSQPICIHSFAEDCLPLAKKLAGLRRENSTLILHSCFEPPKVKTLPAYWALPKKIIYASRYIANAWAEIGVDPAKMVVMHTAHANLKPSPKENSKRRVFIALEPLEEGSGIDFLLKAMSALWQHPYLPEWEVRIMGSGSLFERTFNEAKALGVTSRLALLGDQPFEDILPHAHVLVSPQTHAQGNITALMAAWSMGIPLVCTTVTAHAEVANMGNAFMVPPQDSQRLAAAMIELMCRPERVEHFCNLSVTMQDYAHISRLLNQYSNLYHECIARHGWVLPIQNKNQEQE